MTDWYLYMIRCKQGHLYTGIATDVDRRLKEHQDGSGKGAKYLRGRGPLEVVYRCKIGERGMALKAERAIKNLPRSLKCRLVDGAISITDAVAGLGDERQE